MKTKRNLPQIAPLAISPPFKETSQEVLSGKFRRVPLQIIGDSKPVTLSFVAEAREFSEKCLLAAGYTEKECAALIEGDAFFPNPDLKKDYKKKDSLGGEIAVLAYQTLKAVCQIEKAIEGGDPFEVAFAGINLGRCYEKQRLKIDTMVPYVKGGRQGMEPKRRAREKRMEAAVASFAKDPSKTTFVLYQEERERAILEKRKVIGEKKFYADWKKCKESREAEMKRVSMDWILKYVLSGAIAGRTIAPIS